MFSLQTTVYFKTKFRFIGLLRYTSQISDMQIDFIIMFLIFYRAICLVICLWAKTGWVGGCVLYISVGRHKVKYNLKGYSWGQLEKIGKRIFLILFFISVFFIFIFMFFMNISLPTKKNSLFCQMIGTVLDDLILLSFS